MHVNTLYETKRPLISFEIFPPKGEAQVDNIYQTIDGLASLSPDFISVTYGAGGTSKDNTVKVASNVQNRYNVPTLTHLTCVGMKIEEIEQVLSKMQENGIKNILALRGDRNESLQTGHFTYANELITYIKKRYDFNVVAACYPEKHIEAISLEQDLINLKQKIDCGADMLISQLFFDNNIFYEFREKVRNKGIDVPIIAGIMPITSATQLKRFITLCGATIPLEIQQFLKAYGHNAKAIKEAGIVYATHQIIDLLANDVDGIHIYTMNQADIAQKICDNIRGILYAMKVKKV